MSASKNVPVYLIGGHPSQGLSGKCHFLWAVAMADLIKMPTFPNGLPKQVTGLHRQSGARGM